MFTVTLGAWKEDGRAFVLPPARGSKSRFGHKLYLNTIPGTYYTYWKPRLKNVPAKNHTKIIIMVWESSQSNHLGDTHTHTKRKIQHASTKKRKDLYIHSEKERSVYPKEGKPDLTKMSAATYIPTAAVVSYDEDSGVNQVGQIARQKQGHKCCGKW